MRKVKGRELMFLHKRMENYSFGYFINLFRFLWSFYKHRNNLKGVEIYNFYMIIDDNIPVIVVKCGTSHKEKENRIVYNL